MRWFVALLALVPSTLVAEEKPILVLDPAGHTAKVGKVLFTPDGKELISVSRDKTIRIWDVATGEQLRVLRPPIGQGFEGMLYAAALAPDGTTLAVGGYGCWHGEAQPIYLISLTRGRIEQILSGHSDVILGLAWSPDGRRLLSGSSDATARIWEVKTGKCEQILRRHTKDVHGVTFSPDGRWVATAGDDETARIWEVTTGKVVADLKGHNNKVDCVAWSPDGKTVATGSLDHSIRLWEPDGTFRRAIPELGNDILSLAFSPDSRKLLFTIGGARSPWRSGLLDLKTGKERLRFERHTNSVFDGVLSPDGSLAATTGGYASGTYIWRIRDGKVLRHLVGKGSRIWSSAWTLDGTSIAWGIEWKGGNLLQATTAIDHAFSLQELNWAKKPDGTFRRAKTSLGSLTLEKTGPTSVVVKRGERTRATLKAPRTYEEVRCCTLLPENRVAVGTDFSLYLFDSVTGKEIHEFKGHTGVVWAVSPSPDNRYLLSASNDQTLRIWDVNRTLPLLSLFIAGREWLAWTPEGYYACSPGGESLMGWHLNRGKDKLADFYPAAQFRKQFYRPDVIKLLLRTGSLERALAVADHARGQKTDVFEVAEVLPPLVEITSPPAGKVEKAQLTIHASAQSRSRHPVTAFKLLIDGQQLPGTKGIRTIADPKLGVATASWTVPLDPGRHHLQVLAESQVSQGKSNLVEVRFGGEQPKLRKPRLIVLAIGVSAYQHAGVSKLHYAATDAKALVDTMKKHSTGLFREIKVKLLRDKDATKGNILDGLDWMIKETTDEDYLILFFAGHGELDNAGNLYFLPVEADRDRLRRTAIRGDALPEALKDLPRSRRILMLDACHAGAIGQGRRSNAGATDDLIRDLLLPGYGTVVMCSSTGKEFSLESNEHRMGVFTLALTEGLSGKGPKDAAGTVFTHHLHSYVVDRVKALSKGRQHPLMKNPDDIRSFPLSKPEAP